MLADRMVPAEKLPPERVPLVIVGVPEIVGVAAKRYMLPPVPEPPVVVMGPVEIEVPEVAPAITVTVPLLPEPEPLVVIVTPVGVYMLPALLPGVPVPL